MTITNLFIDTVKGLFDKSSDNTLPRNVFLSSLGILFLTFALSHFMHSDILADVMIGCILSLTNAFLGYVFIERGFKFNDSMFVFFSLGGLALRFFLMLGSVAVILIILTVQIPAFIFAFMGTYVLFLFIEVFYINRKVDLQKQRKLELSIIES
jgi:hypothetical protein